MYIDNFYRTEWLSSYYLHKRVPAMIFVIAERRAWSSGILFEELERQGYKRSYKSFQRDIEVCEQLQLITADKGVWMAGRSTLIATQPDAKHKLSSIKLPSNTKNTFEIKPRKV
jgi:hypothetical protein